MRRIRASPNNEVIINFKIGTGRLGARLTFELAALVVGGERQEHTGSLTELGESELGPPDLLLAAETVGTEEAEPK